MKMNNKGITMISLVIVIIILILLASITAYQATGLINVAKKQSATTNLLLIQAKVRIINEKVIFETEDDKKAELLIGTKLSENNTVLESLKSKGIISEDENIDNYYILSRSNLNDMGLESIDGNDGEYVVNYTNEDVIYTQGIKNTDGTYLYKLSDINV